MTALNDKKPIFALDIGTRSVIGIIIQPIDDEKFEIKDIKLIEHKDRSMLDGQIHDVISVSKTICKVKEALEINNGPLKKVAVAAAGRSLKTVRVSINTNIEGQPLLNKTDIRTLELSAVQGAQKKLLNTNGNDDLTHYHCVGYSVVNYYLDDQIIGSLIDQRGNKATVEIIATFLPRVVVDSLISSLNRVDLELEALTLEPIAAIHVLIPPSMRKINIAFVDIGAGTSDIAITAEGTITAYGMVPVAGDEITEAISQAYLLDFHVAENIKRNLFSNNEIEMCDILGISNTIPVSEIIDKVSDDIDNLASQISGKILELNGAAPQAVILVGGGSQTINLSDKIAVKLNIPLQRVAVRGADAIQYDINWPEEINKGPDLVTPLGIGISSKENPINYSSFTINGDLIHLFEMKSLTIGDALIAAGIPIKKIIGKPGQALTININGKFNIIPGERGTLPKILLNGENADFDTLIYNGDIINIEPGINGKDAYLTLEDALNYSTVTPLNITISGEIKSLKPLLTINGIDADYTSLINDRDSIVFYHVKNIEEALVLSGYSTKFLSEVSYSVQINEDLKHFSHKFRRIYLNGENVNLQTAISNGDKITFDESVRDLPNIKDILEIFIGSDFSAKVRYNGNIITVYPASFKVLANEKIIDLDTKIVPDCTIKVNWEENENIYFRDVFRYIDFNLSDLTLKTKYILLINGDKADFNTIIKSGDNLKFYWQ